MSLYLRIDINIAAMILLGITVLMAFRSLDLQDKLNKTFLKTSLIIILEIFFETMTCVINGRPEHWLMYVSEILHICLFVTAPILTYFWFIFIFQWVISGEDASPQKNILLLIPIVFNFLITLLSPIYGFVFFIDQSNIYHRGNLFLISSAITYFYLLLSFVLITKQRHKILKEDFLPIFIFGILPIVGGLFQTLFYKVLLMWSCSAFSLVIVYNFLQQRMVHLDSLTGVWTRGSFDYFISRRIRLKTDDKFGVIFIDLDGLKRINDQYGHWEGDYAIKTSIDLIKKVLRKTDIVARYGGDEFVVVLNCNSDLVLEQTAERIKAAFAAFNENSNKKYKLECSFGYDIFEADYNSIEQFLHHVDNLMYSNKKQKLVNEPFLP